MKEHNLSLLLINFLASQSFLAPMLVCHYVKRPSFCWFSCFHLSGKISCFCVISETFINVHNKLERDRWRRKQQNKTKVFEQEGNKGQSIPPGCNACLWFKKDIWRMYYLSSMSGFGILKRVTSIHN